MPQASKSLPAIAAKITIDQFIFAPLCTAALYFFKVATEGRPRWVGGWVGGWVGAWVRGCVGAWVRGCVGAWVRTARYALDAGSQGAGGV